MYIKNRKTVLTGIQPTNRIHIGNYIGALKSIIDYGDSFNIIMLIADMHALTNQKIGNRSLSIETAATLIACGMEKNVLMFVQSDLGHNHTMLSWILSCFCPRGLLDRMAQMKDKSKRYGYTLGLYEYPVLQSADIMLYNPDFVPVGEDQKQHIELTKFLCKKMNQVLGEEIFKDFNNREEVLEDYDKNKDIKKIYSLSDSSKKMSKSGDEKGTIFLDDSDNDITLKIQKAQTDSMMFPESEENIVENKRHSIRNLINIYLSITDLKIEDLFLKFGNMTMIMFKNSLTKELISSITPIREKRNDLLQNLEKIESLLKKNTDILSKISIENLEIIKEKVFGK
jgi:tryptophanyl-tRNA synthetase